MVVLGIVASRIGHSRNGRVRNGRSRNGTSTLSTCTSLRLVILSTCTSCWWVSLSTCPVPRESLWLIVPGPGDHYEYLHHPRWVSIVPVPGETVMSICTRPRWLSVNICTSLKWVSLSICISPKWVNMRTFTTPRLGMYCMSWRSQHQFLCWFLSCRLLIISNVLY